MSDDKLPDGRLGTHFQDCWRVHYDCIGPTIATLRADNERLTRERDDLARSVPVALEWQSRAESAERLAQQLREALREIADADLGRITVGAMAHRARRALQPQEANDDPK